MFAKELQVEIQVLARQGKGIREIARLLQCSRKAVRRVLRGKAEDRYGPRAPRPTKLDPYTEYLRERIEHAKPDRLAATVGGRDLRDIDSGFIELDEGSDLATIDLAGVTRLRATQRGLRCRLVASSIRLQHFERPISSIHAPTTSS
jgi:hypothetical protein